MMIRFTESEMEFELQEDRSCNLERSLLYQSLNRHAVSAVECVGVSMSFVARSVLLS